MGKKTTIPKIVLKSKPMDWRWIPYHMCKDLTNMAGIKTFRQYRAWVRDYKPGGIPTRPERVYPEWIDWKTFLETDNVYDADSPKAVREKDLMKYWEAVNLIQTMQFKNVDQYKEAFDDGLIPKGIPKNPARRYPSFYVNGGWKNFLGKDIKHRIEANRNIDPLLILYKTSVQSPNLLSIMIHKQGVSTLMKELRDKQIDVVKIFHWYPDFSGHVFDMLNHYGNKQAENTWLFPNVNEILFELGSVLEVFIV